MISSTAPGSASGHSGAPRRVVVIGAGIVGLSTAFHLAERGLEVVVVDRAGVAAGASWGNAGWISPGLAIPLAEPGVLKYGIKAMLDKNSPLYMPVTFDPSLWRFLVSFARRCTMRTWRRTMAHYVSVNDMAIEAFEELSDHGVDADPIDAPIMAAFVREAESAGLQKEISDIREAGLNLSTEVIDGRALRATVPLVADSVEMAIRIDGQRYIDPGRYLDALAAAATVKDVQIRTGANVIGLRHGSGPVTVELEGGESISGDAVVIATGSWLPQLAKRYGVTVPLRAGRGYSFSVGVPEPVPCPVYFPYQRIACTPLGQRLRVAGTMEFRDVDAPLDQGRVDAIVKAGRPLLDHRVDWKGRRDVWVGGRPVTVDSLPLLGRTRSPEVFVAGGHGMWGITLGPISGKLLAEQITTGRIPPALRPFDPLR